MSHEQVAELPGLGRSLGGTVAECESEPTLFASNPIREMTFGGVDDLTGMHQPLVADADDNRLLDESYRKLLEGRDEDGRLLSDLTEDEAQAIINEGMTFLVLGLKERHDTSSDLEWQRFIRVCRQHPICAILHQDPFTFRAFDKPRGYAGDAELLEFIYGVDEGQGPPHGTSDIGSRIFRYSTGAPVCEGVRFRARLVAGIIDSLAMQMPRPAILSVACGHLQEAALTGALKQRRLGRWVASDLDSESLQQVQQCYGRYGVETMVGSVRQLLGRRLKLGEFDFIYATGLYDYLQQPVAKRLTERLFNILRPGGQLLVANFFTGIEARGYMETFMDWNLIFRSHPEMLDLAMGLDQRQVKDIRLQVEDNRIIVFLTVTKK